jgi:AraC-like DNA-binding protein
METDARFDNQAFEYIRPNLKGLPVKISDSFGLRKENRDGRLSNLHFHDEMEIISVIHGAIRFEFADGSRHLAEEGHTICIGPRTLHATVCESDRYRYDMIQFRPDLFDGEEEKGYRVYLSRLAADQEKRCLLTAGGEFFENVGTICREYRERRDGYEHYIAANIHFILGFLQRNGFLSPVRRTDNAALQRLEPVLNYIDEHYQSDLTLSEVSDLLGISKYYFCRLWKAAIGAGFVDYLNFVRISRAEKRLRRTDDSVLEIALDSGFSSLSYFNRIFRKIRNCSPTVYRKASREG